MGLDVKDLQRDLSDYDDILHYLEDYTTMSKIGKHSAVSHKLIVLLDNLKQYTRKQVCDEIRKFAYDTYKEFGIFDETDLEHILNKIEKGE